jgi:predicted hydrocarbon binding protein
MTPQRKYQFSWDLIGDLEVGRPNLGPTTRLELYRLMQFCFRDVIEEKYGTIEADLIFYQSGYMAGKELYKQFFAGVTDFTAFVKRLQDIAREMLVGVIRIEKADIELGEFVLTVSEDLDCSGLPELDYEICVYDEGFIAGLMESFTGKKFKVKEIDCWCTGDRTCRFTANVIKEEEN